MLIRRAILKQERAEGRQAENKAKELQHEIDGLNKYFKGE
jgi:hypothetical protein